MQKLILIILLLCFFGCSQKTRTSDRADVKKVTTLEFTDKSQTITTKTADSLFSIKGSQVEKSFTPKPFDPAIEADSLDSMETENADVKIKTVVNKKTGKITTQGTAKDKDVRLAVDEKIVENKDVSLDLRAKSDSASKRTEKITTPPPGLNRFRELIEMISVISLVVAGFYLGLKYLIKRSQVK